MRDVGPGKTSATESMFPLVSPIFPDDIDGHYLSPVVISGENTMVVALIARTILEGFKLVWPSL